MRHPLHRLGAIRAFYDDARPDSDPYVQLGQGLEAFQMSEASVWLADELARAGGADQLDEPARFHAVAAVLMGLIALNRGHTRFPLTPDDDFIARTLRALIDHLEFRREAAAPPTGEAPQHPAIHDLLRDIPALAQGVRQFFEHKPLPRLVGVVDDDFAVPPKPFFVRGAWVYIEKTLAREESIARRLAQRCRATCSDDLERALQATLDHHPFTLDATAREATERRIRRLMAYQIGVLTGGPGTGKTTMVLAVLRTLVRSGYKPDEIALAAPTGKAAYRMRQSIEDQLHTMGDLLHPDQLLADNLPSARTLHRLLGYSPWRDAFTRDEDRPIEARVVVVDEASMLDLTLMDALLRALPQSARLLLVGDADQLPAVGSGAAFKDLAVDVLHPSPSSTHIVAPEGALVPGCARLETNFRSNRHIQAIAEGFNSGRFDHSAMLLDGEHMVELAASLGDPSDQRVAFVQPEKDAFELADFFEHWWRTYADIGAAVHDDRTPGDTPLHRRHNQLRHDHQGANFDEASREHLDAIFAAYDAARLLGVTRAHVQAANRAMHFAFRQSYAPAKHDIYLAGEPVMVNQNDYANRLFNGDQGVVLYTMSPDETGPSGPSAKKRVVFATSDGYRAVRIGQIANRLEYAYALTVHKSQGSEFGTIGLMLANHPDSPLNTRELVYTGLTRAKHRALVFGRADVFLTASSRQMLRYSGLRERLEHHLQV